jgi:phospholipid/cholesterol/gamma-HCH transport system substrate-binding protein
MSRRANPKLVGGFVLAAIGLAVAAALVFGSFTVFEPTRKFVVFFQGTVDGLAQGSQVLFRGVPVGKVVDIGIRYDPRDSSFSIPVIIEIRPGVIAKYSPPATLSAEGLKRLIDEGLRARLESASLVTGQQVVQLNFFPGTPVKLQQTDLPYYQLPTLPSPTQQLMSSIDTAAQDLPTLIRKATALVDRGERLLSPENETAVHSLLENAASAMKKLDAAATDLDPLLVGAENTVASAGQLIKHVDGVVQDNRENIRATLHNFREATLNANKLVDQLNQIASENRRPIRQFTEGSLPDLAALIIDARTTVNKATAVLDSLERNPARFIFGNKMDQGVQLK